MVIPKEVLTEYKDIYEKALKLKREDSKYDPPEEPYRSFNESRQLLRGLKQLLTGAVASVLAEQDCNTADELTYRFILAYVWYELGLSFASTGENVEAERAFKECHQIVRDFNSTPGAVIVCVAVLNQLALILAEREEYEEACTTLRQAETIYVAYKENEQQVPLTISDLFGTLDEVVAANSWAELETQYTFSCFYLAQVFGHLKDLKRSGQYCHRALRRQLESGKYDPIDFSLNAATLSQYFIEVSEFKIARHHLAAATVVMNEHESTLATAEGENTEARENFEHRNADVHRCWAKYGLALLQASRDRLYNDDDENEDGQKEAKLNEQETEALADTLEQLTLMADDYTFPTLNVAAIETSVPYAYCLTFADAKRVFERVNQWLDKAKEHYKPETEASEYALIIYDHADCYKLIAFWEENVDYQAKMHRRRARYYEELAGMLNPTFYMNICRPCWHGAAQAFTAIVEIREDQLREESEATAESVKRLNAACMGVIKNYMLYINSYQEKDGTSWKSGMDVDERRTMLLAHFTVGRMYMKMQECILTQQSITNLSNAMKHLNICSLKSAADQEAVQPLVAQISLCRELLELLPKKLQLIRDRLGIQS